MRLTAPAALALLGGAWLLACSAGSTNGSTLSSGGGSNGSGASPGSGGVPIGVGGATGTSGGIGIGNGNGTGTGGSQTAETCNGQLTGYIRDFVANAYMKSVQAHPDFEVATQALHPTTYFGKMYQNNVEPGIVQAMLGADLKPVYAKASDGSNSITTTGQANFEQWYRNDPAVNMGATYIIQFLKDPNNPDPDAYFYDSGTGFFPLDGLLLGNEYTAPPSQQLEPHNWHMTFELHLKFKYKPGQKFTFTGDDDVWVFINNQLAVDLGGVHQKLSGTADLDVLAPNFGLVPDQTYSLDFFWAERHLTQSNFHIDTSLQFIDCGTIVPT